MTIVRWRGVKDLVVDGVTHGSHKVERVHLATVGRGFAVVAALGGRALGIHGIQRAHVASVRGVYKTIRAVTQVVGAGVELALSHGSDGAVP